MFGRGLVFRFLPLQEELMNLLLLILAGKSPWKSQETARGSLPK
jgi:hypothetical protein